MVWVSSVRRRVVVAAAASGGLERRLSVEEQQLDAMAASLASRQRFDTMPQMMRRGARARHDHHDRDIGRKLLSIIG